MANKVEYSLDDPVTVLPGCGAKRAEALRKLNISTVGELIRHYPRGYQNRGNVQSIADAPMGENASFVLTVGTQPTSVRLKGGRTVTKFRAIDDSGVCTVMFFNQPYIRDMAQVGCVFRFWGKLTKGKRGELELYPSAIEAVTEYRSLKGFFPLYPLSAGLTQNNISGLIDIALKGINDSAYPEILPQKARELFGVCSQKEAYRAIHFPESFADIDRGRTRFMAEELFLFACSVSKNREGRKAGTAPEMTMEKSRFDEFLPRLPFTLTRAQSRAIAAVRRDMLSEDRIPMARLISGDVGSGKTVCAAAAAYMTVKNGWQCALMAPTEILASQHFRELKELFFAFDMRCELLTGSTSAAEKRRIYALMSSGEACFIIGTHALLSDGAKFARLGLVITDEQHRFGVMQRSTLAANGTANSGISPHVLVMSATPIPRTLALILCGDLDVSVIDELPPGRQKVDTLVIGEEHRQRLYKFINSQIDEGRQIYIVCPSVESKEEKEEEGVGFLELGYHKQRAEQLSLSLDEPISPQIAASFDAESAEKSTSSRSLNLCSPIAPSVKKGTSLDFLPEYMEKALNQAESRGRAVNFDERPAIVLKSAVEYAAQLQNEIFPNRRIEFIHGRMSGSDKDMIMRRFAASEIDILVSTTVIEVGVNVPNATVMVVENAERFGLSQLHQLRGRVGRGSHKSYCVLISSSHGENAVKRLDVMKRISDGYEIAKYDLEMRGPGDFMPSQGNTRQHGEFKFRLAGLCGDQGMLQLAYAQAQEVMKKDPHLELAEHSELKAELERIFEHGTSALN